MKFLKIDPFDQKPVWESLVSRNIRKNAGNVETNRKGYETLRLLLKSICLRRLKKGNLDLKAILQRTCYVDFSPEEREVYDFFYQRGKSVFSDYTEGKKMARGSVLQNITRMRQVCDHVGLVCTYVNTYIQFNSLIPPTLFLQLYGYIYIYMLPTIYSPLQLIRLALDKHS